MPQDYLSDTDGDLLFQNGDLVVGDATDQHQYDILLSGKGHWRESQDVGVDLINWIDDDAIGDLPGVIIEEFEKDGMTVNKVKVTESGKATIDAEY